MKKILLLALVLSLSLAGNAFSVPMLFDIWEFNPYNWSMSSKTLVGTVSAYTGAQSGVANYNYYSDSGHPINGPTPAPYTSNAWLYYGSDGLSFNVIHGKDNAGGYYWNHVEWDLMFKGTSVNPLLQDDTPENQGEEGFLYAGSTHGYNLWRADFAYKRNTDGGVLGLNPQDYCDWSMIIAPWSTGDVTSINFGNAGGANLNLWSGSNSTYTHNSHCWSNGGYDKWYAVTVHCAPEIPEPGTLILLGSGLLMGAGVLRRRQRHDSK